MGFFYFEPFVATSTVSPRSTKSHRRLPIASLTLIGLLQMNNEEPILVSELNFESPILGESALAYTYFEMYRDAGPERNLRMLCDSEIGGKKRSVAQIGRWSSQFHWQTRVEAYDAHVAHAAFAKLAQQRRDEITKFIDNDMSIALDLQDLCETRPQETNQGR